MAVSALQCSPRTPQVADGDGQRVGGIGGTGRLRKSEDLRDHPLNLLLAGPSRASHSGLDLARGMQRDGDPTTRGSHHRKAGHLGGPHHRGDIVLGEHPLDGHDVRHVLIHPGIKTIGDVQETEIDGVFRWALEHPHPHEGSAAPGELVDDTDTAPGQPWIYPENTHGHTVPRAWDTTSRPTPRRSVLVEGGQDLVGGVEVRVDVLDVVAVLERIDQAQDVPGAVDVDLHLHGRVPDHVGRVVIDPRLL